MNTVYRNGKRAESYSKVESSATKYQLFANG
jgi:hypothetical protein